MRKLYMLILMAFLFLGNIVAQEVLVVNPGVGTLNAAVATYGGDRIYELTAGEWYGLDAPIENVDYHLQIIGSEPAEAGGMPATLQTGSDINGIPFGNMFDAKGDITLKNIYFVNADFNAVVANGFLTESKTSSRVVMDKCVIHPMGVSYLINCQGGGTKTYFTNNLAIDHGHQLSPNDGHTFVYDNTTGIGFDTVWIENNTFVCVGMNFFQGSFANMVNNLYTVNHNTFVFAKSQIDWCDFKQEQYWTNNLMFDVQVDPYANNWQPMPGGDPSMPKPNLIYADTLPGEVMPSTRPNFVQYNAHYRAQGFYDLVDEMNVFCAAQEPKLPGVYLYPLVWPPDTLTSREAQMFANDTDWPNFKYGNTITDVDPAWTDATIYDNEANFIEWASPANYIHALGQPAANYPPTTEWPQYWWIPSGDLSINDVWPVFDGTYTNEQTLKGSIEKNVPLGDLNWWPEAKAAWEENYTEIWDHMRALNEEQIDIGYGTSTATVVDIIVGSPDHTTLEAAVIAAELADDLSGEGPFTVFAPTDDAFAALPEGTLDALLADPTGALADILLYHVVSGKVMSTDLSDGQIATTLLGKDVTVTINNDGVFINNAKVTVADLEADNGVVHVIDAVLIPPAVPATLPIDFETENDAVWEVFANGTGDPSDFMVIDNPDKSGANTSDKVLKFVVNADANPWAGAFSDSYPAVGFTEAAHMVTMMVWKSTTDPVGFKVEQSTNGGPTTEVKVTPTLTGQWEEITLDFSACIGFSYPRIVIFPDFPDTRTAGATVYMDNIAVPQATGIVDVKSEGLFVYPNPAKDILNVRGSKNADITIMNIDGRLVRSAKNVSSVNISDLANGLYTVTIKEGNKVAQQKVLIAR